MSKSLLFEEYPLGGGGQNTSTPLRPESEHPSRGEFGISLFI